MLNVDVPPDVPAVEGEIPPAPPAPIIIEYATFKVTIVSPVNTPPAPPPPP